MILVSFEREVTLFTYQNSLIGLAADCCCMRPANMEWHKLWWEWSRQRSHAVGIGEGMLRSIQASIVCCSQRSWTCHSHGWRPPSGFWDYCGLGNILICGLLMYLRLWNTLKDIWSILYNIVFWNSLDFVMRFFCYFLCVHYFLL